MALVKTTLSTQIKTLLDVLATDTGDANTARQKFADDLSTAIDSYIKSMSISVSTTGSATAQTGLGTVS